MNNLPTATTQTIPRLFWGASGRLASRTAKEAASQTTNLAGKRSLIVLGIETSCDDTSAAVVTSSQEILSLVTHHQTKQHEATGGIVPGVAAMAHAQNLPGVLRQALDQAGLSTLADLQRLDAIAVTRGPGMAPCLGAGLGAAKSLAAVLNKPLIGVHHMEAHALTPRLTEKQGPEFPYLSLLASGGHTLLLLSEGLGKHTILGSTLDDAVGEAFDKVARFLQLPWLPIGGGAGAAVEQFAARATGEHPVDFPVPLRDGRDKPDRRLQFSFSGLKTAVQRHVERTVPAGQLVPEAVQADVAAAFQRAAVRHLVDRVRRALDQLHAPPAQNRMRAVVAAGGVAANAALRAELAKVAQAVDVPLVVPPARLCTDNAAMIAWAGIERLLAGGASDSWEIDYVPKWPLSELNPPFPSAP